VRLSHTLIALVVLLSSFATYAEEIKLTSFLKVDKLSIENDYNRYRFSVCRENGECEVLGREHGHDYSEIRSLSGRLQKYVGVPALAVTQGVAGVFVAFVVGSAAVPAATMGTATMILWGGAVAAPTSASMLSYDTSLRKINPLYHWDKGNAKIDIENAVVALQEDEQNQIAIIFRQENFDDVSDFYETIDIVEAILSDF
jgi:hypothetical protein